MRNSAKILAKATVAAVLASTLATPVALGAEIAPVQTSVEPWVVTTLAKDAGDVRIETYKVDKDLIAWTETSGSQRKLYAYDGVQIRTLAAFDKSEWANDGLGFYDAIDGNFDVADGMIVWTMSDGSDREVYSFDGESVKKVSDNSYDDRHPGTSRGRIAWTSQPSAQYNLMMKDRHGTRMIDSWHVQNYAFSGSNLFWLNKRPNENWFRVFVNGGLGEGDDRPLTQYFITDGKGSAAWEYSTKRWDYDKRVVYESIGGAQAIRLIQRDVPPMVTRVEDMNDGAVIMNVTDLLYTNLQEKASLLHLTGLANFETVWRKPVPAKVRFMDGGYVRHREPGASNALVFRGSDREDFVTLEPVIMDRFDADGDVAAGARVGGGIVTRVGDKNVHITSSVEATSVKVKNGNLGWVEGNSGSQTLKFATRPVMVKTAVGAKTLTGKLVKATNSPAVYLAANDGKRYVFFGEGQYFSWFKNFNSVQSVSSAAVASMPLGGNVLYRPGSRLLKVASSPRIYAVGKDGALHWVTSEEVVTSVFGTYWKQQIDVIDEASLADYAIGAPISQYGAYFAAMTK
jgi:hypothetical protein